MNADFHLRALDSIEVLDKSVAVCAEIFGERRVTIGVHTTIARNHLSLPTVAKVAASDGAVQRLREFFIDNPAVDVVELVVNEGHQTFTYKSSDGITANLTLRYDAGTEDQQRNQLAAMLKTAAREFDLVRRMKLVADTLADTERARSQYYEVAMRDLHAVAARLNATSGEQVLRNDEILSQKLSDLEKRYEARVAALEQEHAAKLRAIEEREAAVKQQLLEFDLSKRMVARRKNFDEIKEALEKQETMKVSDSTEDKRRVVHHICVPTIIIAAVAAVVFGSILVGSRSLAWNLFPPFTVSVLLLASTLVFYIKWNNQWFAEFAEAELTNRKSRTDIIRANWVAELFLEAKETSKIDLPSVLLNNFTANLFKDVRLAARHDHPTDDATKIAARFKKGRIGKDGGEIEMSVGEDGAA